MKNYKLGYFDPETLEKLEIETSVPSDLVTEVKQKLDKLEQYTITPAMVNPENLSITFGVIDNNNILKYNISISPIN